MARRQQDGEFWADKLMDLANFEIIALVFSQLTTSNINWSVLGLGILLYIILSSIARYLRSR